MKCMNNFLQRSSRLCRTMFSDSLTSTKSTPAPRKSLGDLCSGTECPIQFTDVEVHGNRAGYLNQDFFGQWSWLWRSRAGARVLEGDVYDDYEEGSFFLIVKSHWSAVTSPHNSYYINMPPWCPLTLWLNLDNDLLYQERSWLQSRTVTRQSSPMGSSCSSPVSSLPHQ
jgi:hypothetical protein